MKLNSNKKIRNIGFISTRIAETDGVSLEIQKWADVLQLIGFNCFYFAGLLDRPRDRSYKVDEAYFDFPVIQEINADVFGKQTRKPETSTKIQLLKNKLKEAVYDFKKRFEIDLIIPENALSIPMNLPLGLAITEFIAETSIPTIAHHHDFSWERERFLINACSDYLNMAFPPDLPSIAHVVINSLASEQLSYRRGISNTIIPNVLNFSVEPPVPDEYCGDLREKTGLEKGDLFVLQPTRIVPRKWIERSIEIVHYLNLAKPKLIVSHGSGDEGDYYYKRVVEYAQNLDVEIVPIDHLIAPLRGVNAQGEKLYTIADVYNCSDLVTYPSGHEGFGNAFLEAVYYRKPIVSNRYSIYIADIEPKGFDVVILEGFMFPKAIKKIQEILIDKKMLREIVEKNYKLGSKFFSYEILEEKLFSVIRGLELRSDI
jgi:hypothetical protein